MKKDKLDSILNSAETLISEQGVISFKISDLAKLAKCSNATLYSEFNNKEEIIYALYLRDTKDKVKTITNIIETNEINNKDKIIIISMIDIFQFFIKTNNLTKLNHLPNNENLSKTTKGSCIKEFYKLKSLYDKLWSESLKNKELSNSAEEVIALSYELIIYQKGAFEFINDYNLKKVGWNLKPEMIFESIVKKINSLNWVDNSNIDFKSSCDIVSKQLCTNSNLHVNILNDNFESEMEI